MPAEDSQPEHLIQRARSGGAAELNRLLGMYRNYLRLLAQTQFDAQLRIRIDPSDLVQETLMEAFRDFGAFGGNSEPELAAWLRRILVRNATDQAKRHQAQKRDVRRETSLEAAFDRSSLNVQQALAGNFASPSAAAQHREQAAEALDHAHAQGIIHRDIKPANLLLDEEGNLHITDFGLARIEADAGMTMTGDLLGTLRYMSPEQALGHRAIVDHRADVYSLGATLYELLTLRPAVEGADRHELLRNIATEPVAPRRLNPAIPADLETIVLKALGKSPAERYSTAKELSDDLARCSAETRASAEKNSPSAGMNGSRPV